MNGIDFLADTNAILYVMKKNPCMKQFLKFSFGISIITEMELLSFRSITNDEENLTRKLIAKCKNFALSNNIKECAIILRRSYGTKLPDAIVAATAIEFGAPLITADKGFCKISELDLRLIEPEF